MLEVDAQSVRLLTSQCQSSVWVGAESLWTYCRISLFKLLSFWRPGLKYGTDVCRWKAEDKGALSPQHYVRCVGGQGEMVVVVDGHRGDKRLSCYAWTLGCEHLGESLRAPESSRLTLRQERRGRSKKQLSQHKTNTDCHERGGRAE